MQVELDDGMQWPVTWCHQRNGPKAGRTICTVGLPTYVGPGGQPCFWDGRPFEGIAQCPEHDTFCKEAGRKISLARAIASFPKADRRKFWEAYFGRKAEKVIRSSM
jgi:hypothetical protein